MFKPSNSALTLKKKVGGGFLLGSGLHSVGLALLEDTGGPGRVQSCNKRQCSKTDMAIISQDPVQLMFLVEVLH